MAGPNRVVPPLKVGPDGTFDDRYWPRTEPLPPGPPGDPGPEGPQGPKAVIVSTNEPPAADPGDLWYNPEGIPEIGDPVGLTKTEADQLYPAKAVVEEIIPKADRADSRVFDIRAFSGTAPQRFTAAIAAASASGGGEVLAPDPEYDFTSLSSPITIPARVAVKGNGGRITVAAGINITVFDIDGGSNAQLSGFHIVKASGAAAGSSSAGIRIRGAADHVILSNLSVNALMRPIYVCGMDGTTPGIVTNLTLDNVTANDSPGTFGIDILDCDGLHMSNCYASGNWLDGVKLRRKVLNVTIVGGRFNGNGVSGGGDGLDAYAGGDSFTMIGTELSGNNGAGAQIKTGEDNQSDPATNGYVRNVQLHGLRLFGNTGQGMYLTVSQPANMTQPVVSTVSILGGIAQANGGDGWYLNVRNATVTGAIAKHNGTHGFFMAARAMDITFENCLALANSQNSAGSSCGFELTGHSGRLFNCKAIGADAETVATSGDYTALTKYHLFGIRVAASGSGTWRIDNCESLYHVQPGNGITTTKTSGTIIITGQETAGSPLSVPTRGSMGSETINTSATNADDLWWVKASGVPNTSAGWTRVLGWVPARAALPTAASQYKGQMLLKDNAGASEDTLHICVQTGASAYAWKQVTLA